MALHEFVNEMSMSSLHPPTSLIEYAIRRELYGEGLLAVKKDALLTASVAGKYPHLQKAYLKQLDEEKAEKQRADALALARSESLGGLPLNSGRPTTRNTLSACTLPATASTALGAAGQQALKKVGPHLRGGLHGNLGTGNNVSHSFPAHHPGERNAQPPLQVPKRSFMENLALRLTPEERKLVRTLAKHHLRALIKEHGSRGKELVYKVERLIFEQFFSDPSYKEQFFASEQFARDFFLKIAKQLQEPQGWTGTEPPRSSEHDALKVSSHHAYDCGPRCYCMKYQDAALAVKTEQVLPDKSWTKQMGTRSDNVLKQLSALSPVGSKVVAGSSAAAT